MQGSEEKPSLWQKTKKHPVLTSVIIGASLVGVALIAVIILGYRLGWDWTGLDHGLQVTTTKTIRATTTAVQTTPEKTLWDWMQLLIIPLVLAVGGFVFNMTVSRNERRAAAQRDQTEREAAAKRDQTERDIA